MTNGVGYPEDWQRPLFGRSELARDSAERAVERLLRRSLTRSGPLSLERVWEGQLDIQLARQRWEERVRNQTLRAIREHGEGPLVLRVAVSDPPAARAELRAALQASLQEEGCGSCRVEVLRSHKQALSWLTDSVLPRIRDSHLDRRVRSVKLLYPWNPAEDTPRPPRVAAGGPQVQAAEPPIRWLQALYPADGIVAEFLGLAPSAIEFIPGVDRTHYEVHALDEAGNTLFHEGFKPLARRMAYGISGTSGNAAEYWVETGGFLLSSGSQTILEEPFLTAAEHLWDGLRRRWPELLENIRGAGEGALTEPLFRRLEVEAWLPSADEHLGWGCERASVGEGLAEDLYFGFLNAFAELGEKLQARPFRAPGAIVPIVHAPAGRSRMELRLWVNSEEAAVATRALSKLERNLETTHIEAKPEELLALARLVWRVADRREADEYAQLLDSAMEREPRPNHRPGPGGPEGEGGVDLILTWRWGEGDLQRRYSLSASTLWPFPEIPDAPSPNWDGRPPIADDLVAALAHLGQLAGVRVLRGGDSLEGRQIPVLDVGPVDAPALLIRARHHANEISSGIASLRLVQEFATRSIEDPIPVRLVVFPLENPDGAALHALLAAEHPEWAHHCARYNFVGREYGNDYWQGSPLSPEAALLPRVWQVVRPLVVTDDHGVPDHEWVQPFAGYAADPGFRAYWIPRALIYGIMPLTEDSPLQRQLLAYVAARVDSELEAENRRKLETLRKYHTDWAPEKGFGRWDRSWLVEEWPVSPDPNGRRLCQRAPEVTPVDWVTEVSDETATGDRLQRAVAAHLAVDWAVLRFVEQHGAEQTAGGHAGER